MTISIGTKPVTIYRATVDEVTYAGAANDVTNVDTVSLRRTLPVKKGSDNGILRGNINFAKSFQNGDKKSLVVVNATVHTPVGVDPAAVRSWLTNEVFPGVTSVVVLDLATKGDIHLQD